MAEGDGESIGGVGGGGKGGKAELHTHHFRYLPLIAAAVAGDDVLDLGGGVGVHHHPRLRGGDERGGLGAAQGESGAVVRADEGFFDGDSVRGDGADEVEQGTLEEKQALRQGSVNRGADDAVPFGMKRA